MKVKHTQNGNVKLTLTMEEAERLRSVLIDSEVLRRDTCISQATEDTADELNVAMLDAGIDYKF